MKGQYSTTEARAAFHLQNEIELDFPHTSQFFQTLILLHHHSQLEKIIWSQLLFKLIKLTTHYKKRR